MITALSISVVALAAGLLVDSTFVAPVASGYIYRNDHNGPASLIQLGAVPYQQPHAFAPPLPLAQPLKLQALEAYDLAPAPAPLPYIAQKPIIVEDAEDDEDDSDESSEDYLDGSDLVGHHGESDHAHESGGGSEYGEEHHEAQGEKGSKGYKAEDHHADGKSGHYGETHHEGHFNEKEGETKAHHDEADAYGKNYESGEGYKGGNNGHKKHFSKGEDVTGYHKVFHKDEFKKDHDFYDVADNKGHFKKYENGHKKHGSSEEAHKEGGHHDSAHDEGSFGKAGFNAKGHVEEDGEAHTAEEGHDSHYSQEEEHGKKGGSGHEKEYAYDEDDDEDDY